MPFTRRELRKIANASLDFYTHSPAGTKPTPMPLWKKIKYEIYWTFSDASFYCRSRIEDFRRYLRRQLKAKKTNKGERK